MEVRNQYIENPFFSICIPQYNRTSFLIEACKVLAQQTFKNFEVCISDDQSNDGREQELIAYLQNSGLSFIYKRQEKNLRYDANIRSSIALAQGKYCFLHGNDDCLASSTTLEEICQQIQKYGSPGVIITNYEDWKTGQKNQRLRQSQLFDAGVETAATHFRNVAFVTGVIIDRVKAQECYTDKWDGSEMYQMYVVSKIIAGGSSLLELKISAVKKDIYIPGESVDSYAKTPVLNPCPIVERKLPMVLIGQVVADAISPYLDTSNRDRIIESIFLQLYLFTYPFWIIEYRRVQSWKYSLGICLGIHPKNTFLKIKLGWLRIIKLYCLYMIICATGLILPIKLFDQLRGMLFSLSKSMFLSKQVVPLSTHE
ncbi:glycosyltransferase [Dolichospermum circinale]|uniref:glycosyltransferase n=1 Tax=Dolichospermum circinale TaxID=109265 RepID=UPI0003F68D65|nr:glycosyltransferase [Dolichospermum circinale]MDB9476263.1 glycosyltransferase [Dolichospermum circinale CS-537/11]MDB9477192.1 glycosyltransferase [Dolichospermum circinale CS-537/03]